MTAVRPGAAGPGWAAVADAALRRVVAVPAAALVVAEIAVLLAGVVARYVFHKPIVWSDELASILFLWLAMLGAVMALIMLFRPSGITGGREIRLPGLG